MKTSTFDPPAHLSERAREIWSEIVPRIVRSTGKRELLRAALESLDTADKARAELGPASLTTKTLSTGTIHSHPLVKVEREARAQFASIWSALGLNHCREDGWTLETWLKDHEKAER